MRVLVVEDDPHLQRALRVALRASCYTVLSAETGRDAIDALKDLSPDVAILDLGLPDIDGKAVLRQVRAFCLTPIVVVSARSEESEKIAALDLGANAYVEKPFDMGELLARVRAVVRDAASLTYSDGRGLLLDMRMRWVKKNGFPLKLSRKEYDALVLLARHAGRPLAYEEIQAALWGAARAEDVPRLRVLMRQLRLKIEDDPSDPKIILTATGLGYMLAASAV